MELVLPNNYSALNRGCDISGNPYPWDGFISATVR